MCLVILVTGCKWLIPSPDKYVKSLEKELKKEFSYAGKITLPTTLYPSEVVWNFYLSEDKEKSELLGFIERVKEISLRDESFEALNEDGFLYNPRENIQEVLIMILTKNGNTCIYAARTLKERGAHEFSEWKELIVQRTK